MMLVIYVVLLFLFLKTHNSLNAKCIPLYVNSQNGLPLIVQFSISPNIFS